ncbi:MAG: GNAT family N-acetyltransferase [Burkholderiales bacterium]|nr:GNAT family N-acetyltransferase [Burkholderiales bacterium]
MRRYATWTGIDLCFQDFEAELAALPGKYVPPQGQLWIARNTVAVAKGVIAVRAISNLECEMKRLWVEPDTQGSGLGRQLASTAISFARDAGYAVMKLDTLRGRMPAAISLYRSLGFVECEPYIHNPEPDVLYMALKLAPRSA